MSKQDRLPISPAGDRLNAAALLSKLGPLIGLIFVWVLFAALKGHDFVKWDNQRLMLLQTAVVGTAAIGATLIIISGGIDLSVGSSIALGTVVVALLLRAGASPILAARQTREGPLIREGHSIREAPLTLVGHSIHVSVPEEFQGLVAP